MHGESARLDADWRLVAISPALAAALDPDDHTGMALVAWPAIASAERLVAMLGALRSGQAAVALPAADGLGLVSATTSHDEDGHLLGSIWTRLTLLAPAPPPESEEALVSEVASLLAHDGIAPLRRALAFADAAAADDSLSLETAHRLDRVRSELSDGSDLVREIVATLRLPSGGMAGLTPVAEVARAAEERCRVLGLTCRWPKAATGIIPLHADLVIPPLVALAVVAAAVGVNPRWTTTGSRWTFAVTGVDDARRLQRLGASLAVGEGRSVRPRLGLARRFAKINGWDFHCDDGMLSLSGTCTPTEADPCRP